jgi:hypothetical protein
MRTPASCGVCGVMGHTRRTCRIARLRRVGERAGTAPSQEEEDRVKAELRAEFDASQIGILWARYQGEQAERREQARRNMAERREAELERQRAAQQDILSRPLPVPNLDVAHSFSQIISWARRAEREARSQMRTSPQNPRSLSLKMVSDFQENYTVDTECAICYDRTPTVGLPCKHTFCGECTVKFAQKAQNCPLCRCSFHEVHFSRNIQPEEFNKISAKLYL